MPDLIIARHPAWRASWRRDHLELIMERTSAPVTSGAPLIVPVLTQGRSGKTIRFFPLSNWRHLGIYGGEALGALHAMLGSLLYTQSPAELALAILDHGEIASLYRDVAHLVALPATPHDTMEMLAQTIRRTAPRVVRPLLLVVVEPDDNELNRLIELAAWLQARPATPLHLLIVQTCPRSAGRELYAQLPALLMSGGSGPTTLLPGQGSWPKRGAARLVAHGMRVEGRAITLDEVAIVQALTPLRQHVIELPPVLWDASEPIIVAHAPTRTSDHSEAARSELYPLAHQRRIAGAMTRRRKALMDAEQVDVPIVTHDATRVEPLAPILADESAPVEAGIAASIMADRSGPVLTSTIPVVIDDAALIAADALAPTAANDAPTPVLLDDRRPQTEATPLSTRAELFRNTRATGATSAPLETAFVLRSRPLAALVSFNAAADRSDDLLPMHEPENGWPIGPAPLGRVAMADLMSRVVAAPAIVAGLPGEQGVTKNRLVEVFAGIPRAQAKELAEILLAWFDQAGLLVEPTKPGRLRHPRALIPTSHRNAESLFQAGNRVRLIGQLDCRMEFQGGASVVQKLAEIDAERATRKAELAGHPSELRRAEGAYVRLRQRFEAAPRRYVLVGHVELIDGAPIALADTFEQRREFVRAQRALRDERRRRVAADQARPIGASTGRGEIDNHHTEIPVAAEIKDSGTELASGTTKRCIRASPHVQRVISTLIQARMLVWGRSKQHWPSLQAMLGRRARPRP